MGLFNNFLDMLKKQYEEDDFDADEYDDYVADRNRKSAERAAKKAAKEEERKARRVDASMSRYEEEDVEEPVVEEAPKSRTNFRFATEHKQTETPIRTQRQTFVREEEPRATRMTRMTSAGSSVSSMSRNSLAVDILKPSSFEDAQVICDALRAGKSIVLNLETTSPELAQRIIDFVCGCIYTLDGRIHQITGFIFLISPDSVEISGDYIELIRQDGFGVPTFNTRKEQRR